MKKSKKLIIILFVNLLIFISLLFFLNCYIDKYMQGIDNKYLKLIQEKFVYKLYYKTPKIPIEINDDEIEVPVVEQPETNDESFKKFCGEDHFLNGFENNYTKNPIVVFGCSYAYGHGLKKEETFPYLLSKLTQRPVFNFASCGEDIILSYNRLKDYTDTGKDVNKTKIYNTDYIIYIYMYDHINRYLNIDKMYSNYEYIFAPSSGGFEKLIVQSPLGKYILSTIRSRIILDGYPFTNKNDIYLKQIIVRTKEKMKEYAPNAKMIVIVYDEKIPNWHDLNKIKFALDNYKSKIWSEMQNEDGIIVVHTKDLTGFLFDKDYKLKEDIADWHPNAKAWKTFTPLFVEKYIK